MSKKPKPLKKLGRKNRRNDNKKSNSRKRIKKVTLFSPHQGAILLKSQMAKKRRSKIFLRLLVIIII